MPRADGRARGDDGDRRARPRRSEAPAHTVVVGLGNPLRGDDGVGPEVIRRLGSARIPRGVELVDAGAAGLGLLDVLDGFERAVVVDCARMGLAPGSVRVFAEASVRPRGGADARAGDGAAGERLGPHDPDPMAVLALGRALGFAAEVILVGVEPGCTGAGTGLSPAVEAAVPRAVDLILERIGSAGSPGPPAAPETGRSTAGGRRGR